ncbi:MAG TPA: family 1 glycosylhydrolase [Gemmatimonadales bacterium]
MRAPRSLPALEVWGGVECTINRVGDAYHDQLERSGHSRRDDDVDRIADLGVTALRYPLLWEDVAPDGVERASWGRHDSRLARLRELGVEPIVGLLHHGSGPRATSLVDPDFPRAFERYARAAAERYPWVRRWTPINEPLTTARFSTLYGHWHPHARCDRQFARAITGQCRAIGLAMRAIRTVNPDARLVQTEDLGLVRATPLLRDQAEFENERRWLTFDLLCGRVDRHHPLWRFIADAGVPQAELEALRDEPCPPGIVGINHYVTSDRFLDERLDRYPPFTHGGNGRQAYADVEAARVCADAIPGPGGALAAAWERYALPLAVTEAHLGCTREQQLRWLHDVWTAALDQRARGVDVRAVTAWSLLGAYDWHVLVTRAEGCYEPGAFDVRSSPPRPTALARMVRDLARKGMHEHPVLSERGWWRRDDRLIYPAVGPDEPGASWRGDEGGLDGDPAGAPILVTGTTGTLGRAFARVCRARGLACRATSRLELDISDAASVERSLDEIAPWAVVNAAGYVRVDDAEREPGACDRDNHVGPALLATACGRRGIRFVTFSSDLVFDGERGDDVAPYVESDETRPLNAYGRSKAAAERRVLELLPGALVVRTSAFFGPWDAHNFVAHALHALECAVPFAAARDQVVSPTYVPDLVHATLDLLLDGERGIWHLANQGATTWAELARRAATLAGLPVELVEPCDTAALALPAPRPRYSALASERGALLPPLDDALARYCASRAACTQTT